MHNYKELDGVMKEYLDAAFKMAFIKGEIMKSPAYVVDLAYVNSKTFSSSVDYNRASDISKIIEDHGLYTREEVRNFYKRLGLRGVVLTPDPQDTS